MKVICAEEAPTERCSGDTRKDIARTIPRQQKFIGRRKPAVTPAPDETQPQRYLFHLTRSSTLIKSEMQDAQIEIHSRMGHSGRHEKTSAKTIRRLGCYVDNGRIPTTGLNRLRRCHFPRAHDGGAHEDRATPTYVRQPSHLCFTDHAPDGLKVRLLHPLVREPRVPLARRHRPVPEELLDRDDPGPPPPKGSTQTYGANCGSSTLPRPSRHTALSSSGWP